MMRISPGVLLLSSFLSLQSLSVAAPPVAESIEKSDTGIAEFQFNDERGNPIADVKILSVKIKQPNGKRLFVRSGEANEPNLSFAPSDEHGIIRLKEIPLRSTVLINVFHPEFLPPSQIKMECGDPPATFVLRRGDATLKLVFYDVKGTRLTNEEMPLEIYLRSQPINFSLHRILTTNGAFSFRILNTRISESAATHSC